MIGAEPRRRLGGGAECRPADIRYDGTSGPVGGGIRAKLIMLG